MFRSALALGLCLFFGFWAFVYQGYQEDAGTGRLTTWPWGAALYLGAVLLALRMVGLRWPHLSGPRLAGLAVALGLVAVLGALLSLDAG